jgi:hypothetical integral membrane protein (TIGR02206 family)
MADWLHEFHPFSALHGVTVLFITVAAVVLCLWRRRLGATTGRRADIAFAIALATVALTCHGVRYAVDGFQGVSSLPLHLCHLSSVLTPLAIAFAWWPARVLLYFWGLILGTQALVTPELHEGVLHWEFWAFWVGHGAIYAAAIYDLGALGFRPGLKAYTFAVAASLAYLALVTPINVMWETNFGYVGPRLPRRPSILDHLGPWPMRVVWLALIGAVTLLIAALPWEWSIRRDRRAGELQSVAAA